MGCSSPLQCVVQMRMTGCIRESRNHGQVRKQPPRGLGPVILRTQSTVPSERPNGNNGVIFLARLGTRQAGAIERAGAPWLVLCVVFFACEASVFPSIKWESYLFQKNK